MQFDRTTSIDTPEGVRLNITLAGLGSRGGAQVIDWLIKFVAFLVGLFLLAAIDTSIDQVVILLITGATFAVLGYELLFEALWGGRTPGKAAFGLRVVNADGSPAKFAAIAVRNILRIVDILPGTYGVGLILVFTTTNHQRLGDIAAGTVVVRELKSTPSEFGSASLSPVEIPPGFDATAVSDDDVAVIRQFLVRAPDLDDVTQNRLAGRIALPLHDVVFVPGGRLTDVTLLRTIVAAKDAAL